MHVPSGVRSRPGLSRVADAQAGATPCARGGHRAPSFGMIPPSRVPPAISSSAVGDVDRVDHLAVEDEAVDVGEEEQLVGAEPECDRRGGVVGVDVERARLRSARRPGSGRRRGCVTTAAAARDAGRRRGRAPGTGVGLEADLVAEERHRALADRCAERRRSRRRARRGRSRALRASSRGGRRRTRPGCRARSISSADLRARRRGRRRPRCLAASSSTAPAEPPATAPPTLTTKRLTSGSPR